VHGIKGVHAADEEYKLFDVKIRQSSKDIHCSLGKGHGWAVTFRGPKYNHDEPDTPKVQKNQLE